MLDYHCALHELLHRLLPNNAVQTRPLLAASGCYLAKDIVVNIDAPQFSNSAMDGYAIADDQRKCWRVVDRITAGQSMTPTKLQPGEAARIFTGAPLPEGTSAVLMQEQVTLVDRTISTTASIQAGQHIRQRAEELQRGGILLNAGERLSPARLALIASQGYASVPVLTPLTITVFSTGNELINPPQPLVAGKIYDANRYLLLSWLMQLGYRVVDGGILPDSQANIAHALQQAADVSQVILTSGGVSVGEEDHVRAAIEQLGTLVRWQLAIKPGKPFAWGEMRNTSLFMLPGNPVATLVTFHQLVLPALRVLAGASIVTAMPHAITAKSTFSTHRCQSRREFLRVKLTARAATYEAVLLPNQGSAMLATCAQADALAECPPNTLIQVGDLLTLYPLQ